MNDCMPCCVVLSNIFPTMKKLRSEGNTSADDSSVSPCNAASMDSSSVASMYRLWTELNVCEEVGTIAWELSRLSEWLGKVHSNTRT